MPVSNATMAYYLPIQLRVGGPARRPLKGVPRYLCGGRPIGAVIEGIEAQGMRSAATDERSAEVASIEKWSSEVSGVTLEERFFCLNWTHALRLQNLKRGEPDPSLFVVPADYTYKSQ